MAISKVPSKTTAKKPATKRPKKESVKSVINRPDANLDEKQLAKRLEQLKIIYSNERKKTRLALFVILTICAFLTASFFALAIIFVPANSGQTNSEQSKYKVPCVDISAPVPQPDEITIRVMNASGKGGIGTAVADSFKNRGFNVAEIGTASFRLATTQVRFGANAALQARVVAENLVDPTLILDDRVDGLIDVVIGGTFTNLLDTDLINTSSRTAKIEQFPGCVDAEFIPREKALIHDEDLVKSYDDKKPDGDETE